MMKPKLILLLIMLTGLPCFAGDEKDQYLRENRLIEAELGLARKPDIYFVFDLGTHTAHIKARGIRLKEMPVHKARRWGTPLMGTVYHLVKKSALWEPDREMIKPGENKEKDTFEIDALELSDMPSRYTLVFDGGMEIQVRPSTEGIASGASNIFYGLARFLVRPFPMLWHYIKGEPYTVIDMTMDGNDARAVYWSLAEGAGVIIWE
jgi:hypothetical protein